MTTCWACALDSGAFLIALQKEKQTKRYILIMLAIEDKKSWTPENDIVCNHYRDHHAGTYR